MAISYLLNWWYSRGWLWIINRVSEKLYVISQTFSVGILLRTLFSPWKQVYTKITFRNFFQAKLDNLVSRMVGFVVRFALLACSLFLSLAVVLVGLILVIAWPFIPLLIIGLPLYGLKGWV